MRRQTAGVAILAFLLAARSFAQTAPVNVAIGVPPVIRFSGTLAVAAGHVPVTFGLYREETGDELLWAETQILLVDASGRYTVVLGMASPLPANLFVSGEARWLDVAVEGLAPQPRRLLVSVPYALKAADAETVGGKPLSAFLLAGEKTGIGADGLTYVDTRVLASGLATTAGPPSPPGGSGVAGGAGTANFIGVFTDATTLGNSVMYQTPGGYVGMNTTAPQAAFHAVSWAAPVAYFDVFSNALSALPVVYRAARGTVAAPTAVQTNDILGGLAVRGYGATTWSTGRGQVMYKAAENWTDGAQGTYLQFTTTPIGSGAWAERMRIDPAGNVGIGTPAPAQKLSVAGTIETTSGGIKFPDGTTQTTAARSSAAYNAAFGTGSLGSVTSGTSNAAFGDHALSATTTGSNNTAIGAWALYANTSGSGNTASGIAALTANTTGYNNAAGGAWALTNNTAGHDNTASGYFALASNTTGYWNTATGASALYYNTTGTANTASGHMALAANTTGYDNSAFGRVSLAANTTGYANSAFGSHSLWLNTTGTGNAAFGADSLASNTTGRTNAAFGTGSLLANTTGNDNTAIGTSALAANTAGNYNTAAGRYALWSNTTGASNTASGAQALLWNTAGHDNTATGMDALTNNTTGNFNTATGTDALRVNTTGFENTASGYRALRDNTTGYQNTADGNYALASATTGSQNTASGHLALYNNTTGVGNIAVGYAAGLNRTTGSYNIDIGHGGMAAEGNTIRIGMPSYQSRTFIAGIRGVTTGIANTVAVLIDSSGQLGTISSSRRVKDDIADMAAASSALMTLRPVTFHYKSDQNPAGRTLQYGLIAEEVAEVYPGARSAFHRRPGRDGDVPVPAADAPERSPEAAAHHRRAARAGGGGRRADSRADRAG